MGRISSKITSIEPGDSNIEPSLDDTVKAIAPGDEQTIVPKRYEGTIPPAPSGNSVMIDDEAGYGWVTIVSVLTGLAWLALLAYLAFSILDVHLKASSYGVLDWLVISGFVFLPLITLFTGGYALRQLAKLSNQSARLERIGNQLMSPDQTVIGKSKSLAAAIANQVGEVDTRMADAAAQLDGYQTLIAQQVDTLSAHNTQSATTSGEIAAAIKEQATMLDDIAAGFDRRMDALSEMLTRQSGNLTSSSHLAEQKLKEARISVEGAAAKINSASDVVRNNIVQASSSLAGSHQDIQSLGEIIQQRSRELDEVYKKHASELTAMIEQLRDEQQILGSNLEDRLRKMRDMSLSAQASAESLVKASDAGRETVSALAESATLADKAVKARFNEMQDMVQYSAQNARSISDKAAQRVRDSLELTRKEIIRIEHDMVDLQSRLDGHSQHSLELVAHEEPDTEENIAQPKRSRWSRLTLKPLPDEEPNAPTFLESELPAHGKPEQPIVAKDDPQPAEPQLDQSVLDLDIAPVSTETLRRTLPENDSKSSKTKSGFSLRNIFGRTDTAHDASLSITDPGSGLAPVSIPLDRSIFTDLNAMGLPPSGVVDDGCIIEAVNNRVSKGRDAMRSVISMRLKGPVEHLNANIVIDQGMRQRAITFASALDQMIESLGGNREGIRTCLETEDGRAYLLCDAALNLG